MDRRDALQLVTGTAIAPLLASLARAQGRPLRIGLLWHAANAEQEAVYIKAFREGLAEQGYVEGQSIVVEHRFPAEIPERFQSMAAELVRARMDVLVGSGQTAALALQRETTTTPIVFIAAFDPLGSGLVNNFARPSANITGMYFPDLIGKRLELLKQALPSISNVLVLVNVDFAEAARKYIGFVKELGRPLGLSISPLEIHGVADLERSFGAVSGDGKTGLAANPDPLFFAERRRISNLALASNLPSIFHNELFVREGALMSYGTSVIDLFRRAPIMVHKILKGIKVSDIPVEQPDHYKIVLNLRTAKTLKVEIDHVLLTQVTETLD